MSADLYNDAIVAAAKARDRAGRLDEADATATADNPLCGDRVTIDLNGDAAAIHDLAQKTRGCLLTQAAASLLARHLGELRPTEAAALRTAIRAYLKGEAEVPPWPELEIFAPVREVKSRHDCVLIAFEALDKAAKKLG